jgi:hypothetical protein
MLPIESSALPVPSDIFRDFGLDTSQRGKISRNVREKLRPPVFDNAAG